MDKRVRGLARQAGLYSLGMTACLAGVPFLLAPSANFLGKDVSQLAAGIVSFYPMSAVAEVARVLAAGLLVTFVTGWIEAAAARTFSGWTRRLVFPLVPIAAYLCWAAGAVLKYPALYEGALPERLQELTFRSAFWLRPTWLFAAALILLALPVLLAGVRRPTRVRRLAAKGTKPLALITTGALLTVAVHAGRDAKADAARHRAHVLLIGIDSLRSDRLARSEVTPSLRELLSDPQTVSFQDHYVGIPRTFPSWLEMLTGHYAAKTGVRHMFPGFGERNAPFAGLGTELQEAGYATSVVSDFAGDIFPRFEAGFEEVAAPKLTLRTMIRMSVDQGLAGFLPLTTTWPLRGFFPALLESPAFADAAVLGEAADPFLKERADGRPFFTTVFFSTAHFPYAAPFPYYSMFTDRAYAGPYRFEKNPDLGGGTGAAPEAPEVAQVRGLYDGAVRSIDDELGRLFARLKERGLWDQTLVIVTADHGEDLYENGLQGHGEHLRGVNVLRVPLIMKLPKGLTPAVRAVPFTTRSIDVAATALAAAGVGKTAGDGVDLLPWVTGARQDTPGLAAYAETGLWFARGGHGFYQTKRLDYPGVAGLLSFDQGYSGEITLNPVYQNVVVAAKHRTLIDGDYKLIYMPTPKGIQYELYNRRTDPANERDLAAADPKEVAQMRQRLLAFVQQIEGAKATLVDDFVVPH